MQLMRAVGAISMDGAFLFVTNQQSSSLSVIDLGTRAVVQTVTLPAAPQGVEVGADGVPRVRIVQRRQLDRDPILPMRLPLVTKERPAPNVVHAAKPFSEGFSVAMFTAGADLGAAAYRVPRCVCPFDF